MFLPQVEDERNIVRQTFHAAERLTPRKNRCSVRDNDSLAIRQTARANHQGMYMDKELPVDRERVSGHTPPLDRDPLSDIDPLDRDPHL